VNPPGSIIVYVCCAEGSELSDARIRRCAGLYVESGGLGPSGSRKFASKDTPRIYRPDGGKPRFEPGTGIHFSVSHSGGYWICAVSTREVGADIQKKTADYQRKIAERFHPDEYRHLTDNGFADFFGVWAAKESYVKFTGQGIGEGFGEFSVVENGRIAGKVNGASLIPISFHDDGYCLYVCSADDNFMACKPYCHLL